MRANLCPSVSVRLVTREQQRKERVLAETSAEAVRVLDKLYEFDRRPVTSDRLLGPGYFAGSFAGEHVAATEFVIGALFVNWGANVKDIFLGLIIGNLLAVLTWTLICAPIAVQTRLTLYWYLRRIGGPFMTVIYNVLNAVLYCILAGCMITVSASAVRLPFGIPAQVKWYPTDWRFVLVVLFVGAVVVTLAILGFRRLAAFASVCSPWMLVMFLAGALAMLPVLAETSGVGAVRSFAELLEVGRRIVWTGKTPDGSPPLGFWKVAAFAWICNLAMHGGLSDMALFRYARRASYGLCSATGMFLGHYLAWICAGMMGVGAALMLNRPLTELDSGEVAYQALGWCGAIAVVIAGWTTSNPTLYRAGLGLQAVTPNWPRPWVTLVAGTITTIIACFPFVFTRLLEFVGIYGLLLAPAGAIVVTEHWLFPLLGLRCYWTEARRRLLNWPALAAWAIAILFALVLEATGTLHLFFLFLPVYLLTIMLYVMFVAASGVAKGSEPAAQPADEPEQVCGGPAASLRDQSAEPANWVDWLAGIVAVCSLLACLILPLWVFLGSHAGFEWRLNRMKQSLPVPTVLYFIAGTFFYLRWSKRREWAGH